MRRSAALVALAVGALLLTPAASGVPPDITLTITGSTGASGWYRSNVTVKWQVEGENSSSGCDTQTVVLDTPGTRFTCSATSSEGDETIKSVTIKRDATPPVAAATPSRGPDMNGWNTAPVTVTFSAVDAMSGLESCDAARTWAQEAASTLVSGSCRDRAGNIASPGVWLGYDTKPPQVTATARSANAHGWYNAPVEVSFTGSDPTSGVASCDLPKTYGGPDRAAAVVSGTCVDNAGHSASGSMTLSYDATPPQTTPIPSRQPNAAGWYNAPLSVSFEATDGLAGIDSCDAAKSYSTPDAHATSLTGSCRDRAGNSAAASYGFAYDATPPAVTATRSRPPNANGWYTQPLSINFTGGDATSGLESCDGAKPYSSPDAPSVSVSGSCRDAAGNVGTAAVGFKYDATAPQATVTPSRQPNANGWYNAAVSVGFAWTGGASGLGSCETAKSYSGPDSGSVLLTATCSDLAGNSGATSFPLRYDATPPAAAATPARPADANGWYRGPITVDFTGADAMSGIGSCTAPQTYAGPDAGAASVSGSCQDRAGNPSAAAVYPFKYDATAPVVTTGIAVRGPDRGEWYNRPVAFAVQGTDATSGLDSCPAATYAGPDGATALFVGTCSDKAGNQGTKAFPLRYDATGPQVTASATRAADSNGWYNHPLAVTFAGSDAISGVEFCAAPESYGGPDSAVAAVAGVCLDKAGNAGLGSLDVRYDGTPPQVTGASPSRPADANGWYNHPLVVRFQGSDPTSEIEACTDARYAGPDAGAVSVSGSCRDRAGNESPATSFALRYDATPPTLSGVTVKAGTGTAVLRWTASADTNLVEIRRAGRVVYRGTGRSFTDKRLRNGVRYHYTVTGYDEARNAATRALVARPSAPLLSPEAGATVTAPPRLVWKAADKATYYNVQVWRRGKIFSAWPKGTSIRLKRTWVYQRRRYRLSPGRYRWYVWPYRGRRVGALLGSSSFVVR